MPANAARPKPPLTFEDILILFMRRFVAPVAASGLVVGGALLLTFVIVEGLAYADRGLLFLVFLVPAAVTAVGLALFGIPAGYLVARLRRGYRQSLGLLAAIGGAPGLILSILALGIGVPVDLFTPLIFSGAGAVVASLWTLINADLFRLDNGA